MSDDVGVDVRRFWAKVDKTGECWVWRGYTSIPSPGMSKGYGLVYVPRHLGNYVRAHRAAWRLCRGPIPDGLFVLHHCDNPPCVNPDHLFLGTHADNAKDRTMKGRSRGPRGELSGRTSLTVADVLAIRGRLASGESQSSVAASFSVSASCIAGIGRRQRWVDVPSQVCAGPAEVSRE